MAYNLTSGAMDLSFSVTSKDACQIAGIGRHQTWVVNDKSAWGQANMNRQAKPTVEPSLGSSHPPVPALSTDAANVMIPARQGLGRDNEAQIQTLAGPPPPSQLQGWL